DSWYTSHRHWNQPDLLPVGNERFMEKERIHQFPGRRHLESPSLESSPQLDEPCFSFRRNRLSKVEEDFENGGTRLIEELETACGGAVHVPRLFHGEHSRQLLPA